jgi:putative ABC transport system permease protein
VSWLGPRGLALIVRRSLRQHLLSTLVTALSIALASGLTLAVFHILDQSRRAFTGGQLGFDAVLGARGSQLQLVLNAVFHLETSPGNIPWKLYESIRANPMVLRAIPYAVGDNYRGYRVVGTTVELFQDLEYQQGRRYQLEDGGRLFDAEPREAVLGAVVARRTGLRRGDRFRPYHGLAFDPNAQHEQVFEVVGVLQPTSTPADRVVWIPIDALYRIEGHVLRGSGEAYTPEAGQPIAEEHREVSAVMLKFRTPQAGFMLDQTINKQGKVATLAWPIAAVVADLFERLGWLNRVLALVAYLVVAVAAGSVLASIYNTMNERRREFAILRALGARRRTVFSAIVLEAAAIGGLGVGAGFGVYLAIFAAARAILRAQTGVVLELGFQPVLLAAPLGIVGLSVLAGLLPAFKAYSTDVASSLAPQT